MVHADSCCVTKSKHDFVKNCHFNMSPFQLVFSFPGNFAGLRTAVCLYCRHACQGALPTLWTALPVGLYPCRQLLSLSMCCLQGLMLHKRVRAAPDCQ